MIMNEQLEIFVKCFYVRTKIGLRALSLAFFFGFRLDFHFKILDWTRSGKNLSPLISTRFACLSVLPLKILVLSYRKV